MEEVKEKKFERISGKIFEIIFKRVLEEIIGKLTIDSHARFFQKKHIFGKKFG